MIKSSTPALQAPQVLLLLSQTNPTPKPSGHLKTPISPNTPTEKPTSTMSKDSPKRPDHPLPTNTICPWSGQNLQKKPRPLFQKRPILLTPVSTTATKPPALGLTLSQRWSQRRKKKESSLRISRYKEKRTQKLTWTLTTHVLQISTHSWDTQ